MKSMISLIDTNVIINFIIRDMIIMKRQEFKEIHDSYVILVYQVLAKQVKYFKETNGCWEIMCQMFEELADKRAEEHQNGAYYG